MEDITHKNLTTIWRQYWQNKGYKTKLIFGIFLLIIILISFPLFFNYIETRDGHQINDWLLVHINSTNLSYPIFGLIWFSAILVIVEAVKKPAFFLLFLWAFIVLSISRIVTITIVPLNPPNNLIPLIDPISNTFYGGKFITKDLFYSGHTSTVFLMYLCLNNKWHKLFTLIASILIGIMVLVQHVHYTIDVVAAPIFTFAVYMIAKKIVS